MVETACTFVPTDRRHCDDLVSIFDQTFLSGHHTRLVKGGAEPVYLPAAQYGQCHCIIFTSDYFASALHEISHWCIAGAVRRQQEDYGYWYTPDGRSSVQQRHFEQVEIRPQALEWIFSTAARYRFRISADNVGMQNSVNDTFSDAIYQQVLAYCHLGLPRRAGKFMWALASFYGCRDPLNPSLYNRQSLG